MKMLKCGVIGAGILGKAHLRACAQFPYAQPVAVCDIDEKRANDAAQVYEAEAYTDYEEMIDKADLDVIHVVTPDFAHRDPVVKSLQSGRHVLTEKPMATTMDDARAIYEAARSAPGKLMVNFSNRWNVPHHNTKMVIDSGELGELKHAYARLSNTTYVPTQMLSWASKSSPTMFLLPHTVDLVRWFFSAEAETVYAVKTEGVLKSMGIDTHDTMTALVTFDNGAVGCFETSWILPESQPHIVDHYVKVIGSKGMTYVNMNEHTLKKFAEKAEYTRKTDTMFGKGRGFPYDSIYHFLECVIEDKEPINNETDGLMNTAVLCAMLESAEKGEPVKAERF
jgi:predicted dehydrogenase